MILTEPFITGRSQIIKELFAHYGRILISVICIIGLGLLIASIFWGYRFLILFLIWFFLVSPFALTFIYISEGLRPVTAINSSLHTVAIGKEKISISVFENHVKKNQNNKKDAYDWKEPKKEDLITPKENPDLKTPIHTFSVSAQNIKELDFRPKGFILSLKDEDKGLLWLPYSSFKSNGDASEAINRLRNKNICQ